MSYFIPGDFTLNSDPLFADPDKSKVWRKYCGFLELSLEEFMFIQKRLLTEQLELISDSELAGKIAQVQIPKSVEEFRKTVPLTTYKDYAPYLSQKTDTMLPEKPVIWAHTSGRTGTFKWAPYTARTVARLADDTLSAFILSSATKKGEMRVYEGTKVLLNLPPVPYITGIMGVVANQRLSYQALPPLEESENMQFEERIRQGLTMALYKGMDYAASIAVVLVKLGAGLSHIDSGKRFSLPSWQPVAVMRLLRGWLKSKMLRRELLPSDLWKVRGLVCGGTDTAIYREQIKHYWGIEPLDVYVSTETCFIAMQAWDKKDMTFIPYTNFYEFIPEKDWLKAREDAGYQPATVLLDEVEEGETYEVVITSFNGGAFLRYRLGDLIKITALRDKEAGINLPQMTFYSRCDDIIDISAFTRLDEKTIWQALQNTGVPFIDWTARKESSAGKPVLRIYIEISRDNLSQDVMEQFIDRELLALDSGYRDLRAMVGIKPLTVTLLPPGTFEKYTQRMRAAGFDLAHLKPPHMNARDAIVNDLLFTA